MMSLNAELQRYSHSRLLRASKVQRQHITKRQVVCFLTAAPIYPIMWFSLTLLSRKEKRGFDYRSDRTSGVLSNIIRETQSGEKMQGLSIKYRKQVPIPPGDSLFLEFICPFIPISTNNVLLLVLSSLCKFQEETFLFPGYTPPYPDHSCLMWALLPFLGVMSGYLLQRR